jgi:transposase
VEEHGILDTVMTTPASSPDIKPIEHLWSALKGYLPKEIKPKTKNELIGGIRTFWESLTKNKCCSYIYHIHRVIPFDILDGGGPSDF